MNRHGYHWTPCSRGGGWITVLALVVIACILGHAVARPVEHAAGDVLHFLEIAAIVAGSAAGAVAAGAAAYVTATRRHRALSASERPSPATAVRVRRAEPVTARTEPTAAVPAAPQELHLHLHGVTAADLAAITASHSNPAAIVNARRDDSGEHCSNCGDLVGSVSSRFWCDGCEEEAGPGTAADWRDRAAEMEDRAKDLLRYDMDPVTASLLGLHTAGQRMAWARTASWRWAGYRGPLGEHGHIEPEDGTR